MRTLGVLGGMAWPSTAEAYRLINIEVQRRRGGVHSAPMIVWSFDSAEVEHLQATGDWDGAGRLLAGRRADSRPLGPRGCCCVRTRCMWLQTSSKPRRRSPCCTSQTRRRKRSAVTGCGTLGCSVLASRWKLTSTAAGSSSTGWTSPCQIRMTGNSCTGSSTASCGSMISDRSCRVDAVVSCRGEDLRLSVSGAVGAGVRRDRRRNVPRRRVGGWRR